MTAFVRKERNGGKAQGMTDRFPLIPGKINYFPSYFCLIIGAIMAVISGWVLTLAIPEAHQPMPGAKAAERFLSRQVDALREAHQRLVLGLCHEKTEERLSRRGA